MTAVADIVRDALQILGVVDPNEAPEAEDEATAIRALNLMCRAWEVQGMTLGWQDVSGPGEELPAPPEAEEAIAYNLALRLRPRYGTELSADIVQQANDGLATLSAQITANTFARTEFPDLPAGVGSRFGSWRDGFFQ
ncbi:packaged DNA stabilization gp4 family protein [Pseudoxanthomonas dokdonensis]|uniref:Uncharacterized protein n=1 Tax=Pseudoxanthomonas dokdonensis TaxID=344882 RepID=A0A0R0CIR4_9GAMM|nr:packaged DNA stabilization gp4 family protein [Pseudoxanthomonas dokdonensis]KRG69126.1 hypothetical protein ABB29_11985 [Pseudoxanthomonas dokdonensis]